MDGGMTDGEVVKWLWSDVNGTTLGVSISAHFRSFSFSV